jgi:hypothetical protein
MRSRILSLIDALSMQADGLGHDTAARAQIHVALERLLQRPPETALLRRIVAYHGDIQVGIGTKPARPDQGTV